MTTQELTVSSGSSFDTKERIKQAIDIVELIGSFMQLRRQGRNFVGLCPWHDDSRPSLQVNPERQSFKCWVCDIGGDIFSFIMKMEGVDFREALQMLAERAGIELERHEAHHAAPGQFDKRTLYKAAAWAERQYHDCLCNSPDADPARRYLDQRGITAESIEKFHLGFSPVERDWILTKAGKHESSQRAAGRARILEAVGILARPAEGGNYYDRFKGRLLFSIRDAQGRPVGCGGRVLPEILTTSPAKYVNSPETPLFTKSKLLYGLDQARETLRHNKPALVMEGYTDVIVAHQYGFTNAVAVLGTALGAEHIKILKRYTDRIVLVLDGDEAGQKRTNEVLELFIAQQVDLRILTLPENLDPCDFLHAQGAAAFETMLAEQSVDALDHAFQSVTRGIDVDRDVHAASQALERIVTMVARAPRLTVETTGADRFREEKILQRIAMHFRVNEQEVRRRLTALRRAAASKPAYPSAAGTSQSPPAFEQTVEKPDVNQRAVMEMILACPASLSIFREQMSADWLGRGVCRTIFDALCKQQDKGFEPSFERLMTEFDEPTIKNMLVEFDEAGHEKGLSGDSALELIPEILKSFQRKEAERQRPRELGELRNGGKDASEQAAMLEEILRQERRRQGMTEPMDG